MKLYILKISEFGHAAKNKGCIGAGKTKLVIRACDREDAYRQACQQFLPEDRRPLSGKSYIRETKLAVGRPVTIDKGYATGYASNGTPVLSYKGTISEVLGDEHVSVKFPEYHTEYVDFHVSELG